MVDPSKFLDWLKLPSKTLLAVSIVCGVLLWSPDSTLDTLGLRPVVDGFRPYLGTGFLIASCLVVVNFGAALLKFFRPWIFEAIWIRRGQKRLRSLTPDEKNVLRYFIVNQTRTQNLPIQSGVVSGLVQDKILVQATMLGDIRGFDFNIQPWAWEYLNANPQLLE